MTNADYMNFKRDSCPAISSRANANFKKLFSLQTSKGIKQNGVFLAGGEKIIREVIRDNKEQVITWIRAPDMPGMPPALPGTKQITFSKERFNEINLIGTAGPLIELRLPDIRRFGAKEPWPEGCSLFVPFGDPENIGAVIRSAVGMGVARVVLLSEAACPFLPRAIRASAGSILRIRLEYGPALADIASLSEKNSLYSLDMHGQHLAGVTWPQTFGLIAGMEGTGLPAGVKEKCQSVSIPLENGLDSLNAAAAVSIALWDWKTKKSKDIPPPLVR